MQNAIVVTLLLLAGAAVCLVAFDMFFSRKRRITKGFRPKGVGDAANQLRIVMAASFQKKRVMSKAEYSVFRVIESYVNAKHRGHRVLCQTSLGEVIGSNDERAFRAINSKRVDILVINPTGQAVVAVEYQGGRHYQGDAAARDAVKREALRKAGIELIEIAEGHSGDEIRQLIASAITRVQGGPATVTGPWKAAASS